MDGVSNFLYRDCTKPETWISIQNLDVSTAFLADNYNGVPNIIQGSNELGVK